MAAESEPKQWGKGIFWGVGTEYDHEWVLTPKQKELQQQIMELCRLKIRPHAIHCDRTYDFPRESLNAMAELGLLGLVCPPEIGGRGENHVGAAMVVETIARYGCPSTAMVYTMHLGACATLLFRYHNNERVSDLLSRLDKEKLVGTLSYSDPATGGHFWFPLSSKVRNMSDSTLKILKYGSWATSAGHADWYTVQTVSPDFGGDYSDLSCFLVYKEEVRASTDDWSALGMHGNQSGPLVIEGIFNKDRMVGPQGDGANSNDECVDPYFLLLSSACWNGIAMASIDLARRHVTRKTHGDVGVRVCDYPTIQDYFGDSLTTTNMSRSHVFLMAQAMDKDSNNNDWSLHRDLTFQPRFKYLHWLWQAKLFSAKNVNEVGDAMLHACGGSGYKTDLGLERLVRDGKAGWVMGPSNEVLRQFVGQTCLMGMKAVDYWEKNFNERALCHELGRMPLKKKKELAEQLMKEAQQEESGTRACHENQDKDFENPFHIASPVYTGEPYCSTEGVKHKAALCPAEGVSLKLKCKSDLSERLGSFVFTLPNETDYTGCLPGQYVQVRVKIDGRVHERYFSPVSRPLDFGLIELVLRFETQGAVSQHFRKLKIGDEAEFLGPCGGFEYEPNVLKELTLLASGGGITPGMQLLRCVISNPNDKTKVKLLYFSENINEILYNDELEKLAKDSRLEVVHTLGEAPEGWEGEEGFIDSTMIDKHVTKDFSHQHKIVMCGGPAMTITCLHALRAFGFPSDAAFIYGQFGTEQVRVVYGNNVKLASHRCDNVV